MTLDPKNITLEKVAEFTRDTNANHDLEFAAWWDGRLALTLRSRLAVRGLGKDDTLRELVKLAFMYGKLAGLIEMRNL